MKRLSAREILRDKRIYTTVSGLELNVSFTPYAVEVMYDDYIQKQVEIIKIMGRYREILAELEKGINIEQNEKEIQYWHDLKNEIKEGTWKIIELTLKANDQQYSTQELQEILTREEIPFLVQFILGLDEESKKNEKIKARRS